MRSPQPRDLVRLLPCLEPPPDARGHHQPPDRRPADQDRLQVQAGPLQRQARPPDQRLLLPARRGPARVRRPARRHPRAGEAALDRAARDQRGPADLPSSTESRGRRSSRQPDRRHAGDRPRVVARRRAAASPPTRPAELLRLFTEAGHDVTVVPTAAALQFVGAATWAALSGKPVSTEVWSDVARGAARPVGQAADLVVVAPATADLLAKAAHGLADDLLTNTLLTARCPVVFAPAMHTEMWEHPATQANVATLRARGAHRARARRRAGSPAPTPARAACPSPRRDLSRACHATCCARGGGPARDLAGPARRRLRRRHPRAARPGALPRQPLARASRASPSPRPPPRAGREVTLVAANVDAARPGRRRRRAGRDDRASCSDAVAAAADGADAVVMAAAPADFRPAPVREAKIKKADDGDGARRSSSSRTPTSSPSSSRRDAREPGQVVVGFAAETGDATARCSTTPAPSSPARAATCSSSTTSAADQALRHGRQRSARRARAAATRSTTCRSAPRTPSPTRLGHSLAAAGLSTGLSPARRVIRRPADSRSLRRRTAHAPDPRTD